MPPSRIPDSGSTISSRRVVRNPGPGFIIPRFAITAVGGHLETPLKQRLIGATVLVALGVIFIPILLEGGKEDARLTVSMEIPPQPRVEFEDRLETPPKALNDEPPQPLREAITPVKQKISPAPEPAKVNSGTPSSPAPVKSATTNAPKKAPASADDGKWIVQAGSFSRETNAVVLRDQLQTKGFKAFVENASTAAGAVYRVRIGPVEEREAAEALVKRLSSSGNYRGMVMSYP